MVNVCSLAQPHEGSVDPCGIFWKWFWEGFITRKFQSRVRGQSALVYNGNTSLSSFSFSVIIASPFILDANQSTLFLGIVPMMPYSSVSQPGVDGPLQVLGVLN